MSSLSKRLSVSSIHSRRSASPASIRFVAAPNTESEEWVRVWENTTAQGTCDTLLPPPILNIPSSPGRRSGSCCRSRDRGRGGMRCEHASLPSAHLELSRQSHTAPPVPGHLMPRREVLRSRRALFWLIRRTPPLLVVTGWLDRAR
jgi:hypothetical protein